MIKLQNFLKIIIFLFTVNTAYAATTVISIVSTIQEGKQLGTITVTDTPHGLLLTPNLSGLPAGLHGFHVHQNPSCADKGMAAGGHLDPDHSGKHLGPYNAKGHLGDLPALLVDQNGNATLPVLAPRLKLADIQGHSLMIHEGGDNYSDDPKPLGGGGIRIACGVVR